MSSQFEHNLKARIKYKLIKIKKIIFVILFLFRFLIGGLGDIPQQAKCRFYRKVYTDTLLAQLQQLLLGVA